MKNKTMATAMALIDNANDALEGFTFNEILASTVKDAEKAHRAERFRSAEFARKKKSGGKGRKDRNREQYTVAKNDRLFYRSWNLYTKGLDAYGKTHKIRKDEAKAEEEMKNAVADDKGVAIDEAEYYIAVDRKVYELEQQKKNINKSLIYLNVVITDAIRRAEALKAELSDVEAQLKSDYIV